MTPTVRSSVLSAPADPATAYPAAADPAAGCAGADPIRRRAGAILLAVGGLPATRLVGGFAAGLGALLSPPRSRAADTDTAVAAEGPPLPMMALTAVAPRGGFVQGLSEIGSAANANFISNAGFVETADSVVVIDALGSPALGKRLLDALRQRFGKPVSDVIVTHYHADHVYGLQSFRDGGARITAHRAGQAYLTSDTGRLRLEQSRIDLWPWIDDDTRLVGADRWIDGPTRLRIGGVDFDLEPVGPSHTAEDLVVHVPAERLLFSGDLVFAGRIPYVGQADSRHWIAALEGLRDLDLAVLVPGHGPESREPRRDIDLTRDYLVHLRTAMGEAAANLEPFDAAYAGADWSRFSRLPLFDAVNRMNAYNTFLLMEQER